MTLSAGDTVYLSLDLDPERDATTWNGALGLGLFGNGANQTLPVDDPGLDPIPSEAMFMTVKTAGTYYARVTAAGGGGPTETYNLSATIIPAAAPSASCTTHASVAVDLDHAFMADVDAHLRSPAGNDNGLFTDIGATSIGPETHMDIQFDDDAALPPLFALTTPFMLQPELFYRLSWFDGESAGGTWTLDLRDDASGDGGTLNGWSLTLCEPPPEPAATDTIFSTDFETGAAGFTHSGSADEWELGLPATVAAPGIAAFSDCASGTSCWKTDLDGSYEANSSQDLLSPPISLVGRTGTIYASWQQRFQMETANFDHMSVSVEEDPLANARPLYTWLDATMTNTVGNPVVIIGESAGWARKRADISSYAGKTIRLRFHVDSDTVVQFPGLAIDDVNVYQPAFALTVTTAGTGQGFVDSSPVGIDCGTFGTHTDCNQTYNDGQLVTLTAHPSAGSTFSSFSGGGCAGPSPCVVTMDQARSVTATFALAPVYSATVLSDNPAGYWRFGEASGTVATDSSGNGNHGTYLNGPLLGQTGALVGDTNKAASFDGVNDTVRVPDSNSLDVGDSFSLEGWVKRTPGASSQTLFNKGANGIQLTVMNAANGNQLWLRKANVTTIARSNAPVPADGAYHYFVVTKSGPSTVIYIDNVPSTTIVAPVQVIANTALPLTFADPGSTVHVFDEWALYDGVLTATDVNEHYDAGT